MPSRLKSLREALADDLSGRSELLANALRLADEGLQDDILGALLIDEIAAPDLRRWLQFSADAAVALFEPRRVPRQIDMDEVVTLHLKVDAFARGVGADQDAQRLVRRIGIEPALGVVGGCEGGLDVGLPSSADYL